MQTTFKEMFYGNLWQILSKDLENLRVKTHLFSEHLNPERYSILCFHFYTNLVYEILTNRALA